MASRALARVALRGVVLTGGVIAGVLLVSGLASAATDDTQADASQSQSASRSSLITLPLSLAPLTSRATELTASVKQVVSVATAPVLPDVHVTTPTIEPPVPGVAVVVADLGPRPAASVPAPADRPVVAGEHRNGTEAVSHLAAPELVRTEPVASLDSPIRSANAADVPASAPLPPSPDPAPIRLEMPCAPVPAPPAPASQPSSVNAVEAGLVDGPASGYMHVRMVRSASQRPIAIAEEPGSTPD